MAPAMPLHASVVSGFPRLPPSDDSCVDRGPWRCDEHGCPAERISCAALATQCASRFDKLWQMQPPAGTAGRFVWHECPVTCDVCGASSQERRCRAGSQARTLQSTSQGVEMIVAPADGARYTVGRLLGQGTNPTFEAVDDCTGKPVVLKLFVEGGSRGVRWPLAAVESSATSGTRWRTVPPPQWTRYNNNVCHEQKLGCTSMLNELSVLNRLAAHGHGGGGASSGGGAGSGGGGGGGRHVLRLLEVAEWRPGELQGSMARYLDAFDARYGMSASRQAKLREQNRTGPALSPSREGWWYALALPRLHSLDLDATSGSCAPRADPRLYMRSVLLGLSRAHSAGLVGCRCASASPHATRDTTPRSSSCHVTLAGTFSAARDRPCSRHRNAPAPQVNADFKPPHVMCERSEHAGSVGATGGAGWRYVVVDWDGALDATAAGEAMHSSSYCSHMGTEGWHTPELTLGKLSHFPQGCAISAAFDVWAAGLTFAAAFGCHDLLAPARLWWGAEAQANSTAPHHGSRAAATTRGAGGPALTDDAAAVSRSGANALLNLAGSEAVLAFLQATPGFAAATEWLPRALRRGVVVPPTPLAQFVRRSVGCDSAAAWTHEPLAYDLVERMLQLEPTRRLTAAQALQHPFLAAAGAA